jgi:hypothetical protein
MLRRMHVELKPNASKYRSGLTRGCNSAATGRLRPAGIHAKAGARRVVRMKLVHFVWASPSDGQFYEVAPMWPSLEWTEASIYQDSAPRAEGDGLKAAR